jgi:hypothetical protein
MSVFSSARRKSLGRGELDLVVFRFVKPEDAEAFRDQPGLVDRHGAFHAP